MNTQLTPPSVSTEKGSLHGHPPRVKLGDAYATVGF